MCFKRRQISESNTFSQLVKHTASMFSTQQLFKFTPIQKCYVRRLRSTRKRLPSPVTTSTATSDETGHKNQTPGPGLVRDLLSSSVNTNKEEVPPEFPSDIADWPKYRDQSRRSYRPQVSPEDTSILLFPGQGSQFVGMGQHLLEYPNVPEIYERASKILGYDLLNLCLNGPQTELDKTVHQQPAIIATSLAAVERLKQDRPAAIENCISAAGFSVGEISALVFAGAISFDNAIQFAKIRAEAMQKASELVASGMMTIFLKPSNRVNFACLAARKYCEERLGIEDPVCEVANYLFPECKVLAGHTEALDFIDSMKTEFGISRTKRLAVSGAFHSRLMLPAKESIGRYLKVMPIKDPVIPVHSNVTGHRYTRADRVRKLLLDQVCKPVQWEQIMHAIYERKDGTKFPLTFEAGPGGQLGMLLKKTNRKAHEQFSEVVV